MKAPVARLRALAELSRQHLPRHVTSDGSFDDWETQAVALVALASELADGMASNPPHRSRVIGETVGRSLAEYAITFAWLMAVEGPEDRTLRARQLMRDDYEERSKLENYLDGLSKRRAYRSIFKQWPALLEIRLNEDNRRTLHGLRAEKELAGADVRASEADKRWMGEIDLVTIMPFAVIYALLFKRSSSLSHPSITGLAQATQGVPGRLLVGNITAGEGAYSQGSYAFASMLFVAARTLGWPDEQRIWAAIGSKPMPSGGP